MKNDVRQDSRNVDPLQKEKCSAKEFLPQNPSDASVGRKFFPFSHFCSHYHVIANRMSAKGVFRDHVIATWGPAELFYWSVYISRKFLLQKLTHICSEYVQELVLEI